MGKFHAVVWVPVTKPAGKEMPIIALDTGQILYEAWYYFRSPSAQDKSPSWFEKAAEYIGAYYDYYRAVHGTGEISQEKANRLIHDCISALEDGSVQLDGTDPTGLFWKPWAPSKVEHAKFVLRAFFRSMGDLWGDDNVLTASSFAQATLSADAREQKKFHSKLYHLATRSEQDRGFANSAASKAARVARRAGSAKVFPEALLRPLIFEGCRRKRVAADYGHPLANRYNIPLMMAIVLLAGGGLRKSELFHLYTDDVRSDEIRIYDPVRGRIRWRSKATNTLETGQRLTYLRECFQRAPRNRLGRGDAEHAGFKSMLFDKDEPHFYAVVQWISRQKRALFYYLFRIYRDYMLPKRLDHPYLFVSFSQSEFGRPWTIGAFNDAFNEALIRIGEMMDAEHGLNPHALRHLYGQTLVDMGMRPTVIQHAMHHKSIESQIVYTKPSIERVRQMLEAASRFNSDEGFALPDDNELLDYNWKSDPLKLFAPWNLGSAK